MGESKDRFIMNNQFSFENKDDLPKEIMDFVNGLQSSYHQSLREACRELARCGKAKIALKIVEDLKKKIDSLR